MNISIKSTPKDIFLHLFNIVTFYMSVVSYITLVMQYINVVFPDPLNYYLSGTLSSIFWSTSILAVAFPAYILTSWFMERDFSREPAKRDLAVHKWLIYLTLFIAAVTILGDLITLLYNFLNGELTIPFFLKIVIVLAVASGVFGYYFWDLRQSVKKDSSRIRKQIAWAISGLVVVTIIVGFVIAGTPATQRARRFDEQRVNDLQMIQGQVLDYWMRKAALPATAEDLNNPLNGFSFPHDPDTGTPYTYRPTGALSFELCADFQTDGSGSPYTSPYIITKPINPRPLSNDGMMTQEPWTHGKGTACFTRTIDPQLYKPQPQTENSSNTKKISPYQPQ